MKRLENSPCVGLFLLIVDINYLFNFSRSGGEKMKNEN